MSHSALSRTCPPNGHEHLCSNNVLRVHFPRHPTSPPPPGHEHFCSNNVLSECTFLDTQHHPPSPQHEHFCCNNVLRVHFPRHPISPPPPHGHEHFCSNNMLRVHFPRHPTPPPCEQKDRNAENITFAILRMRAVIKLIAF